MNEFEEKKQEHNILRRVTRSKRREDILSRKLHFLFFCSYFLEF